MWRGQRCWTRCGLVGTRFSPALSASVGQLCITRRLQHSAAGSTSGGAGNPSGATTSPAEEDREDLERERQLREKFAQKMNNTKWNVDAGEGKVEGGGMPFTSGLNSNAANKSFFSPLSPPPALRSPTKRISSFTLFLLMTLLMLPLLVLQPMMKTMSGLTWNEVPVLTSAYYLLLRTIASREDQARIQKEYTAASRTAPQLTLDQFMNQHYPAMFQGYRTSQQELVAAVGTCLTAEDTIAFVRTMSKAAGMARDPKAASDRVMDALRKDYAHNF